MIRCVHGMPELPRGSSKRKAVLYGMRNPAARGLPGVRRPQSAERRGTTNLDKRTLSERDICTSFWEPLPAKGRRHAADMPVSTKMSSRPEELHLRALPEPCMTLSSHTAPDVRPSPWHNVQWASQRAATGSSTAPTVNSSKPGSSRPLRPPRLRASRISGVRDEGPQSASGRSSFPAETANGPLHPPNRGKSRVFRGDGELRVSAGLRGGPGRTRTGNQTVISSMLLPQQPASFQSMTG
jgi:hypothetical protein